MQVISGPTGEEISREIAEILNLEIINPEYKVFKDGENYIRISEELDDNVLIIQSCHYPQETNLFQLLNLVSTVKRLQNSDVTVYVPYLCYARADKDILGGEAISIKTVLELLKAVGVDHLVTLDIHNPEVFDFVDGIKMTNIFPTISWAEYLKNNLDNTNQLQIIAPDEGAKERAKALADELDVPYTHLYKNRDPKTGEIDLSIGDAEIQASEVVIVDDIMSTGSTLIEASSLLTTRSVSRVHVLISHSLGTDSVDRLREIGNGLVAASNSVPSPISIISSTKDLIRVLDL